MPKPTTHTDIVVVTKEDPKTRSVESIQITLAADGTQKNVFGHKKLKESWSPPGLLAAPPVGLRVEVGEKIVELIYETRVTHKNSRAQTRSEPWPGGDAPALSNPMSLQWTSAAERALITKFELLVYATIGGAPLDIKVDSSSTSTMRKLHLDFRSGATLIGQLTMTAVMEAQPAF